MSPVQGMSLRKVWASLLTERVEGREKLTYGGGSDVGSDIVLP